ncbi:hypothetical protein AAFC00_003939 [Neodothiora populina]|uniref:Uncharacterized protein n=1 Tax=Neodothiora populina TaxID=2781224 RepID=A0ABR3PI25_9PEZI
MLVSVFSAVAVAAVAVSASPTPISKRDDSWGGAVSLGPTKSNIINAVTTLIPGVPPKTQNGELFLWPGMSNGTGDLVQTTLEQWPQGNSWCGADASQWCVRASLFGSFGQLDADAAPVNGDDHVRIEYNLAADQDTWVQNVTNALTGAYYSSFSHKSGPYMTGYGTGTECDDSCTGTISSQRYLNTTITLRSADTTFGDTLTSSGGANHTGIEMLQGGKVWRIAEIYLPAMDASS